MTNDLNIMVAGAAGQGLQTIGYVLAKIFVRGGGRVFAGQEIQSRIRGGHNTFQLRVSRIPVKTLALPLDILVALDQQSIDKHLGELHDGGLVLFDSEQSRGIEGDPRFLGLPLERLAVETGGRALFSNSVAVGGIMAVLGWEVGRMDDFFQEYYSDKPEAARGNAQAARAGYEYVVKQAPVYRGARIAAEKSEPRLLITGHEAVSLGALVAGCRFMSAYPMSPSTGIMVYLAGKADEFGLVVEQAEDEIAAVNMAIGASFAGVRSLTATSGGGFSLMVEALGLAGITETPLVIVNGQRPGPSTGMATKTAQADLLFTLHAGQDEFPRLILAPGDARQAFHGTIKAFDLAEKYQIPAIILTEHYFANSYFTEDRFDVSGLALERHLLTPEQAAGIKQYKRYLLTDSGISPRAVPGQFPLEIGVDSHEHDEVGHISEDPRMRIAQMDKRLRKMDGLAREISPPLVFGDAGAELALVGWGATLGALEEAVRTLNEDGLSVKGVIFSELWPFPREAALGLLEGVSRWFAVEGNYSGQLAHLMQMEILKKPDGFIRKFTGRPFTPAEIVDSFKREVLQ
ncbi:MAG: 2-oxoacid:acceptor oxidoreductase subunit alpha [Pseudomonadota bacterium]